MQLLIVHDDAEVGEQLLTMVRDYTVHGCDLVDRDAAAYHWAKKHQRCDLLLVQVQGNNIDGLALAASLSESFAGLQTFFFPAYQASRHRVEIAKTKVFPEPINGERLLEAIDDVEKAGPGPDLFDVVDVLQMCCLSELDGAVQLVQESKTGIVYLRAGNVVHVESTTSGFETLREMLSWGLIEFAYDQGARASETMSLPWDKVIGQTVIRPEEKKPERKETQSTGPSSVAEPPKKRGLFGFFRRS